ncbi:MAG: hypothetical protein O2913_14155, partial [Chloroflexi bacterium]|nr:hypothetical protein [Chloroflexota bacterium]
GYLNRQYAVNTLGIRPAKGRYSDLPHQYPEYRIDPPAPFAEKAFSIRHCQVRQLEVLGNGA